VPLLQSPSEVLKTSKGGGLLIFKQFDAIEQISFWARLVGLALVAHLLLLPTAAQASELCYTVEDNTVTNSSGCSGHVVIDGPTTIGYGAFAGADQIETITIGTSVTTIDDYAFQGATGLKSLSLGNSVQTIGRSAFVNAISLTSLTIPNSVTSIGDGAFYGLSSLSYLSLGYGVVTIGDAAFSGGNSVTYLEIPNSVTSMGIYVFSQMYFLKTLIIGNGLTSISENAFNYATSLTSLTLGNNIQHIGNAAFADLYELTSLTIPDTVTSIGDSAFYKPIKLTSLTLGNSLQTIGSQAFIDCLSLEKVTFPESVVSIGENAFSHAEELREINFLGNDPTLGNTVFTNTPVDLIVNVDAAATGFNTPKWYEFTIIKREKVKPKSYSISYFGNSPDVILEPVDLEKYTESSTVTIVAEIPVRPGFTFLGWNSSADGSGTGYAAGDTFIMGSSDTSLYAQWRINSYLLAFDSNGGPKLNLDSQLRGYGSTLEVPTLSNDQLRFGYTFQGWNTAVDGSGATFAPAATFKYPAHDSTLFAQWKIKSYSLTYDGNSHERGELPASMTREFNSLVTVASPSRKLIRKGYTFQGWNTSREGEGRTFLEGESFSMGTYDVILYAIWKPNTYQVKFLNTSSNPIPNSEFLTGGQLKSAPTPSARPGYTFKGWSSTPDRKGVITFPYSPGVTRNISLYAVWVKNKQ
jgi:uncharacterized repeat protein (TIGR02543 family)